MSFELAAKTVEKVSTDVGKNKKFNPDKRAEKVDIKNREAGKRFDPDKRAEKTELSNIKEKISEVQKEEFNDELTADMDIRNCPVSNGLWTGERGNSIWIPDDDFIPQNDALNPSKLSWKELKDKYNIKGITFKNGEPDFSEVSKGKVEIEKYTADRNKNFVQADIAMAKERGCSPEEVVEWRASNKYTWHELKDCKTMLKVPSEIHGNIPHRGGISEVKKGV